MSKIKITFLTGAGVSVPSGIRPFRGENGIWNEIDIDRNGSAKSFVMYPKETWDLWGAMKNLVLESQPNIIHRYIAGLENKYDVTVITQNVDELHQRAGSSDVIELHGSLNRMKCSSWSCDLKSYYDNHKYEYIEKCSKCGWALRPDIVLFGEQLKSRDMNRAKRAATDCDIFIAVGTTLKVSPASHLVKFAVDSKAHTVLISKDGIGTIEDAFYESYIGKGAEEVLPKIFSRGFDLANKHQIREEEDMNVLPIKKTVSDNSWTFRNKETNQDDKLVHGFTEMIDVVLTLKRNAADEAFVLFSQKKFKCDFVLKKQKSDLKGTWYKIKKTYTGRIEEEKIWIGSWLNSYMEQPPKYLYIKIE